MTQFHEGQEVEVQEYHIGLSRRYWHKAKIVRKNPTNNWVVEFADGKRVVSDAEHIRHTTEDRVNALMTQLAGSLQR